MKNKQLFVGLLCIIAVVFLVLFAGCDNTQNVNVVGPKAKKVSNVTAVYDGSSSVTVFWDPVENASSYTIYYQPEGAKGVTQVGSISGGTGGSYTVSTSYDNGRYGVQTHDYRYTLGSDIAWSDYINIPFHY